MHGSVGKYWFAELHTLVLHVYTTHVTFINITTNLVRKIVMVWEADKLMMMDINFPKL
jgi:hypothetical protein